MCQCPYDHNQHPAKYFCYDCDKYFCEKFELGHKYSNSKHQSVPISEVKPKNSVFLSRICPQHQQPYLCFDEQCKRLVCGICGMLKEHKGHDFISMEEAAGVCVKELPEMIKTAKGKTNQISNTLKDITHVNGEIAILKDKTHTQISDKFEEVGHNLEFIFLFFLFSFFFSFFFFSSFFWMILNICIEFLFFRFEAFWMHTKISWRAKSIWSSKTNDPFWRVKKVICWNVWRFWGVWVMNRFRV